jgi:hypothetical protein
MTAIVQLVNARFPTRIGARRWGLVMGDAP